MIKLKVLIVLVFVVCVQGYVSVYSRVNACISGPCKNRGKCIPFGSFDYKCLGDQHHPCDSKPCKNGGTCKHTSSSGYKCVCQNGCWGRNCQITPCTLNPCRNGGICSTTTVFPYYVCKCGCRFFGAKCERGSYNKSHCADCWFGVCYCSGRYRYPCRCKEGRTCGYIKY